MSQNTFQVAKGRYDAAKLEARRTAVLTLEGAKVIPSGTHAQHWARKSLNAFNDQWVKSGRRVDWDWPEIFRRHASTLDALDVAIWTADDRLAALSLMTTTGDAVCIAMIEGDPRADCPLSGKRLTICMEVAAVYAQRLGKPALRAYPKTESVAKLLVDGFGFTLVSPRKEDPYYRREV